MRTFLPPLLFTFTLLVLSQTTASAVDIKQVKLIGLASEGHRFTEGPALGPDGSLYFTDIPDSEIWRIAPDGTESVFTDQSRRANGLMFNAAGELVACETEGAVVAWNVETKERRLIADQYQGKPFNSPNDLVIDQQGGIYFTDPSFSSTRTLPQTVMSVYYISPDEEVTRVIDSLPAPNGIMLSRDEKRLYVFPTRSPEMRAYTILAPGKLGPEQEFGQVVPPTNGGIVGCDGATLDSDGNLYITTASGIQIMQPDGTQVGVVPVPQIPANVTFGAEGFLYVTAKDTVYKYSSPARGHRFAIPVASPEGR